MRSQVGLESITTNKASGGDGIPVELFQILKDDTVKVLHSICQQIWKSEQWPQDWKRSVFIPIPKKGNVKECSNYHAFSLSSFTFIKWLFSSSFSATMVVSSVYLRLLIFLYAPTDVGNLISSSSAFSKSSLYIRKFLVHVLLKPSLENFEHFFTRM